MTRRPTIHDVAAAAGVSVATVSKAVNGRYGVSPTTVSRVLDAVKTLGYESSLVASSMRSRRTGVIGVLVADIEPFSAEILKGVGGALSDTGYDLLAYTGARRDGEGWERRSLSRLSGTLIDAAIIVTPTIVTVASEVPIVAIDPHTGRGVVPTVESDSFTGAQQAVHYLVQLGHRRIGFIAGRPDLRSAVARASGYRAGLSAAGIPFDPALVGVGRYAQDVAREAAEAMLSLDDPPTAVFAANDLSALSIIDVAADRGLRVPEDLSVVGFDDVPEAAYFTPPLTTVRQDFDELGRLALKLLLDQLAGGAAEERHVVIASRLVVRKSSAPPR